jgi:hypothetical protein
MPAIVACGGRRKAFDRFRTAHRDEPSGELPVLLVDSETPVRTPPWDHVRDRVGDHWSRPDGVDDDQLQFMATCMETWLMGDPGTLRRLFGSEFRPSALLPLERLEERSASDVQTALEMATRGCPRGRRYERGGRSFALLRELDPKVLDGSSGGPRLESFCRLIESLTARLQ